MARRRKSKGKRGPKAVRVTLGWLEIALGFDEWGRGDPDPAILLGLVVLEEGTVSLLSRGLVRPRVPSPYPNDIDGGSKVLVTAKPPRASRLGLLVLALEEDGGQDVRDLYAMLERPDFTLWSDEGSEPNPRSLSAWLQEPRGVYRVHAIHGDEDLAERCRSDDWVGAALVVAPTAGEDYRVHTRSADGRNDWTFELRLRV
ncbi:MAG: hypothetical protein AAGE52_14825 [Myxococcota bacterium]